MRENLDEVAGLESLSIISKRQGPPGKDIDIRITPNDKSEKIIKSKYVASEIKRVLSNMKGFQIYMMTYHGVKIIN